MRDNNDIATTILILMFLVSDKTTIGHSIKTVRGLEEHDIKDGGH